MKFPAGRQLGGMLVLQGLEWLLLMHASDFRATDPGSTNCIIWKNPYISLGSFGGDSNKLASPYRIQRPPLKILWGTHGGMEEEVGETLVP
jgi:hypothetical protein